MVDRYGKLCEQIRHGRALFRHGPAAREEVRPEAQGRLQEAVGDGRGGEGHGVLIISPIQPHVFASPPSSSGTSVVRTFVLRRAVLVQTRKGMRRLQNQFSADKF